MNSNIIVYCNFSELAHIIGVKEFPPPNSKCIISNWLKIYYYLFLTGNIRKSLNNDILNNLTQNIYFKEILKIDQPKSTDILNKEKFHFENNLQMLVDTLKKNRCSVEIDDSFFKIYCIDNCFYVQQFPPQGRLSIKNSATVLGCIIKSLVDENKIDSSVANRVDYICHDKHIDGPQKADYLFIEFDKKRFAEAVKEVLNGYLNNIDILSIEEIISFQHESYSETVKSINKINSTIDYSSLIKLLKDQQKKDELIELKKKLINLWLPLAIDIQGISELKEKKKQVNYYQEIRDELLSKGHLDELKKGWDEFKEFMKNDCDINMPIALIGFIENTEPKNAFFTDDNKNEPEFYKMYLMKTIEEDNSKENSNFLPSWLQKVVNRLDKKINIFTEGELRKKVIGIFKSHGEESVSQLLNSVEYGLKNFKLCDQGVLNWEDYKTQLVTPALAGWDQFKQRFDQYRPYLLLLEFDHEVESILQNIKAFDPFWTEFSSMKTNPGVEISKKTLNALQLLEKISVTLIEISSILGITEIQ